MAGTSKKKRLEKTVSLGEIIGEILNRRNSRAAPALRHVQIWEHWEKMVGSNIAKQAWPLNFKSGVLFVGTSNRAWIVELQYQKHRLVEKINQELGRNIVKDIMIRRAKRD